VIAKDVQFHPVTETPLHFDLYRVDAHHRSASWCRCASAITGIAGLKRGGALNINLHEVEVWPGD